jgi:hypothetical protein
VVDVRNNGNIPNVQTQSIGFLSRVQRKNSG